MHETDSQNGVLFYLAVTNREFAVIGDGGINSVVPEDFWDKIKEIASEAFQDRKIH